MSPQETEMPVAAANSNGEGANTEKTPWGGLRWHTTPADELPTVAEKDGVLEPNILMRAGENLLARFQGQDDSEQLENIRQEVRAIASRWLRMDNVSVLMGAGASKYALGFVTSGLAGRVQELLKGRPADRVFDALLKQASKPDDLGKRFEDFLSQLSALIRLSDNSQWPLDRIAIDVPLKGIRTAAKRKTLLKELLLDIERAIVIACNGELPPSPLFGAGEKLTAHEVLLAKLVARDPKQGRARIFTTNYDLLIENAADRLGVVYSDGFVGTVARHFNPAAYDVDFHYSGRDPEGHVRRYGKVLQLFKLHGSINWRKTQTDAQNPYGITFQAGPLPIQKQVIEERKSKTRPDSFERALTAERSLAILPTSAKYGESLTMPFAHMFRSLGETLREPQTVLFVLGYSGWDSHINRIIDDALTNPGFICVIVDPVASPWARRLCKADYCGRVYYFGGEWGKFEFFAHNVLPDLETLKTELDVARTMRELQVLRTAQAPAASEASAG